MNRKGVFILLAVSLIALAFLTWFIAGRYKNKGDNVYLENYVSEQDSIMHDMIKDMMSIEETESADKNYINGMIPHHQAAIKMSETFLKYDNSNNQMTKLANNIIKTQNEEIEYMKTLLNTITEKDSQKTLYYINEYNNSMESSHIHSNNYKTISQTFAESMIEHHQMAINMSEIILKYGDNKNVKSLAERIIENQKKEINEMEIFLQQ
ncbi:MAG: DUF305 domain-containing protein [Lachnospirales bacterium]